MATTTDAAREIELSTKQQSTAVEQVNVAIANVAQATRETEASSGRGAPDRFPAREHVAGPRPARAEPRRREPMAKDRYRYFRIEARELLDALSRGLLDLERSPGDKALVATLLRHAHTLKGAARVVQQADIGDLAHAAEDALGAHRAEGSPPVAAERFDGLLRIVDDIAARVAALDAPADTPSAVAAREADEVVRVGPARRRGGPRRGVRGRSTGARGTPPGERARPRAGDRPGPRDQLAVRGGAGDAPGRAQRALVDELGRALQSARRTLEVRADRAGHEIAQVRRSADRLRLVPARAIFGALERAVRDAARELGREVDVPGGGRPAPRRGERPPARPGGAAPRRPERGGARHRARRRTGSAPGKPRAGQVAVEVERRGRNLVFRCRDDGRGLDRPAILGAAVRQGVVTEAEARRPGPGRALRPAPARRTLHLPAR